MKKSELTRMVREEIANIKEAEVTLPAGVRRFMLKFISALKGSNLNRKRQIAVLGGVVDSMGIDPSKLMQIIKKIKRGMNVDEGRYPLSMVTEAVLMTEVADHSLTKIAVKLGSGDKNEEWDAAVELTGGSVRPTSLKKNQIYMMRERSTAGHFNYSMDRFPVIFLGGGREKWDKLLKKTKYDWFGAEKNKKIKDMEYGDYYYFKGVSVKRGQGKVDRVYMFGAYEWNGSLAIGSGASGVSMYKIDKSAAKKWDVN